MGKLSSFRVAQFHTLRDAVKELTGIVFEDNDMDFMLRRLKPMAEGLDCEDFDDFLDKVRRGTTLVRNGLIDAVTTRETHWFRDRGFETLLGEHLLPQAAERAREEGRKTVRIWSAASSSGQEAYSIAIILAELNEKNRLAGLPLPNFQIRGTDISPSAVASASEGFYEGVAMDRGLPPAYRSRYFDREASGHRVKERLRKLTRFEKMNLTQISDRSEDWDLILLRNVLIYFTPEMRAKILDRMARKLRPEGCFVMGGSEDPQRYSKAWERKVAGGNAYFIPEA
jgi:chemotaxis protein methyltransferase CheR